MVWLFVGMQDLFDGLDCFFCEMVEFQEYGVVVVLQFLVEFLYYLVVLVVVFDEVFVFVVCGEVVEWVGYVCVGWVVVIFDQWIDLEVFEVCECGVCVIGYCIVVVCVGWVFVCVYQVV